MTGEIDDQEEGTGESVALSISVSTDGGRFLRRTCPSCGRDFKTEVDPADLQWAVAPLIRRMGVEIGSDPGEGHQEPGNLICPYCGHQAKASDMLTEETVRYLQRLVQREVVIPVLHKQLSDFADSVAGNQRSSGGGFLSIGVAHDPGVLPPRPIHGPEPPDMRQVEFLCCGKAIKVSHHCSAITVCTYCGTDVVLV